MSYKVGAAIIAATLLIWGIIHLVTYRETTEMSVAYVGWDTKIDVMRWQTNHYSGWYAPANAEITNTYIKYRGTERYISGYKLSCRNSKCDRTAIYNTRRVYDRWYEYNLDEWTRIQPLISKGIGHNWYMPDISDGVYTDGVNPQIGDKKLGLRSTHFYIIISNGKDKNISLDMPESRWKVYRVGNWCIVEFNWFGSVIDIKKKGIF